MQDLRSHRPCLRGSPPGIANAQDGVPFSCAEKFLVLRSSSKSAIHLVMEVFHGQEVGEI